MVADHVSTTELPVINQPFRFWAGFAVDSRELIRERELIRALIAREIRQRYKGSRFGWGWALAKPLVLLAVYGIAIGIFLGAGRSIPEFAIYLYVGLLPWTFFSVSVISSISALPSNSGLITKAAFRKESLIFAVLVVALIDLFVQSTILCVAFLIYGSWPRIEQLWWILPALTVLLLFAAAMSFLLAACNVYLRDVGYLTDVLMQVGFWSVPIVYAYSMVTSTLTSVPLLINLYTLNPMLAVINAFRFALWPSSDFGVSSGLLLGEMQTLRLLGFWTLVSLCLLWLAQRIFSRASGNMAQEL